MKTKILRVPVALGLSLLLWSGAGLAETRCQNESFSVITDFDGANIHSCHLAKKGLVEVEIRPEDEPINKSPWYVSCVIHRRRHPASGAELRWVQAPL